MHAWMFSNDSIYMHIYIWSILKKLNPRIIEIRSIHVKFEKQS
jgi:hypothetical protein